MCIRDRKYRPTSSGKDQGCVRQWITSFIFFFDHEQVVSWESCNLIGSGSWQYFILFTGLGWYWEKLCPLSWYSVLCGGPVGMIPWDSQFLILEQELHYIFVKKSIFLRGLNNYVVWTYQIKFNNLASLWVYFLSPSISFEEWNFFSASCVHCSCSSFTVISLKWLLVSFFYLLNSPKNVKTWGE